MHSSLLQGETVLVQKQFDMVTLPVVFVSNQHRMIWDMTEASVFKTIENPLHHMVAYLCMMQQNIDEMCSLSGYTRQHFAACLRVCV